MNKIKGNKEILTLTLTAIFIAIILVFNFTFLGFIKVGLIEISLIGIPVGVGAVLLGKKSGVILGTTFGILSFAQCFGMSAFGTALMAINPIYTFIMCIVPRVLMGALSAWVFQLLKKTKLPQTISSTIACIVCALTNTIGFVGLFIAFFSRTDFFTSLQTEMGVSNLFAFIVAFVGINGLVEVLANAVVGAAMSPVIQRLNRQMRSVK